MPGCTYEQFANLRALYGYQWLFTGKPLLFMGGEFGQRSEWDVNGEIEWDTLESERFPLGLQNWVKDLNHYIGMSRFYGYKKAYIMVFIGSIALMTQIVSLALSVKQLMVVGVL